MTEESRAFLLELLNTPSPAGFESAGQQAWVNHVRGFAHEVESDAYGTAWGIVKGPDDEAPRVMLEAHADEIGFVVRHISDDGYVYFSRLGGSDRAIARGRRVTILCDAGPVTGIIGNTAIHLRETKDEKIPEWHELYIDIGVTSREEATEAGVRVGVPIVYADGVEPFGEHRLTGRALDNRIGGFIVAEALQKLAGEPKGLAASVYAVNAVQEEIGGHGAKMVAYRLHPSVAVVVDVTHATDSPGIDQKKFGKVELGRGPTVTHGAANHPLVVRRLVEVAAGAGIPLQHEATSRSTGTDTDDIYTAKSGVPSALLSVPMRYMHSPVEMVDLRDVEHCIDLLAAFARSVTPADRFAVVL